MGLKEWVAGKLGYVPSKPGDWMEAQVALHATPMKPLSHTVEAAKYDADAAYEAIGTTPIKSPCGEFIEALRDGKATVASAYLFAGRFNLDGKLLRESDPKVKSYRTVRASGAQVKAMLESTESKLNALKLKESDGLEFDSSLGLNDPAQYTEYTPLMGGPHFKQLYLYDYLTQHARAFEAWNHHPVAKRVINILAQYALGRGYKALAKKGNTKQQEAWDAFEMKNGIKQKLTRFWIREFLLYGELMVDKVLWQSIDPSTVWDIITDPDNIDDVYYYHQQYPTAYAMFTGKQVPGVKGAADQKPIEYVIRQLPYDRVLHIKTNVVSNEKRGRSVLFPILGWLKRIKDLYNAEVIGAWLRASFIWDDTIDGSDSDVSAHLTAYSGMPSPGSIFAHNKAIERKAMSPDSQGATNSEAIAAQLMALIATSVGIPKEHLNVAAQGGGSRATALVSSEPFTKVVEELQDQFEDLLQRIASVAMEQANVPYEHGDIEFIFPSVAKDTTSETIKNILSMEASGYISKQTAGNMSAAEMNITSYDFEEEQGLAKDEQEEDMKRATGMMPPPSRQPGLPPEQPAPAAPPEAQGGTPIAGDGRLKLKNELSAL